jgi:hypothetical protein
MAAPRYIARRRLLVGTGYVQAGHEYPASEVTHSLLAIGWVVDATMATDEERAALESRTAATESVTPKEALLEERDAPAPRSRRRRAETEDAE